MRLSKIKLAGFKSFVDPTSIHLLSNLTAVAGPNGCGKSNVIDAVRWVMGESSAKHLRGGALTDVIFSGSSARKPVGQATVELLFDNAQGKLGGEYASYSEIAIKRQVTRDGQSNYFLNGQRCRRRDITDIFLGTGLGPRSYAIIEQGMITRVIEAKPEDLRVFLEETAGISKYKERRRETENRIQHTQDNIARLNDLRSELESQLRHLQKQSQSAERYKALKAQEEETSTQLAALAWHRLDQEITSHEAKIRENTTLLEAAQANIQHYKTEQEKQRLSQAESQETLNEVQKHFYAVGAEIAKIEQAIQHTKDRDAQLITDKAEAEQALETTQHQLNQDKTGIIALQQQIDELEPRQEIINEQVARALEVQQQAEIALDQWRENVTKCQQDAMIPTRQAEAEKVKITQLERQIHQTQERQSRLEAELQQQQASNEAVDLNILDEKIYLVSQQTEEIIAHYADNDLQKEALLEKLTILRAQIKGELQSLHEMQGQQAALQALQAVALGKDEGQKKTWLKEQGLASQPYLAEILKVTEGWEHAVEIVLGNFLDAVGVDNGQLIPLSSHLKKIKDVGINLIEWQSCTNETKSSEGSSLSQYINGRESLPANILALLSSVRTCATLDEALEHLPQLSEGSLITPDGYWLGPGWARVIGKPAQEKEGVLRREEILKNLIQKIQANQHSLEALQSQLDEYENKLKQLEKDKDLLQQNKNRLQQELMDLQSELKIKQNRIEQNRKREGQIQQELAECQGLVQSAQQEVNVARGNLTIALERMSELNDEQGILTKQKTFLQEKVDSARRQIKEISTDAQNIALNLQTYRTQIKSMSENVERYRKQIENSQIRINGIHQSLEKNKEPLSALQDDLTQKLESRLMIEQSLTKARDKVAELDQHFRSLEQEINQHEQNMDYLRQDHEQTKMSWQALTVRRESVLEHLRNIEGPIQNILVGIPHDASEESWQAKLSELQQKIHRLGAINLAAIEEYQAAQQRKEYLDTQCNDLTEALTTLENAIKKIDRETRTKFKETFDKVNQEFTQLFPRLFGGGQAQLVMTGEDLLDAGITLIARPPGKKNSTIQQLSGGEKALTAVALVFSLFQLNPAPFCMLDEVDAPLDDNNVGRFCNLVKEMSKTVQFIYVSHNKLAIEMAEQLQGVTMREPGVSRLVTVDIEEAKSMAQV